MRRGLLAVVVGLGAFAAATSARADQVVLSPLGVTEYSTDQKGVTVSNPPYSGGVDLTPILGPSGSGYFEDRLRLEFSLSSLPAQAVISSATLTYQASFVAGIVGPNPGPFKLDIYTLDSGQTDPYGLPFPGFSAMATIQTIPSVGVYTTSFSDLSTLHDRATKVLDGKLELALAAGTYPFYAGCSIWIGQPASSPSVQLPQLTITYAVPEPAGVGMLGVGVMVLLRRRTCR